MEYLPSDYKVDYGFSILLNCVKQPTKQMSIYMYSKFGDSMCAAYD